MTYARVKSNPGFPDGWNYLQQFHGKEWRLDAGTRDELYEVVMKFRLAHGIELGAFMDEVDDQICSRHPPQCNPDYIPVIEVNMPAGTATGRENVDSVNRWANAMMHKERKLVERSVAERRAEVCSRCEHHKAWLHQCPPCVDKARQLLTNIAGGRELPPQYKEVGMCDAAGWCNKTAAWLAMELLPEAATQPEKCWVHNEDLCK